MSQIVPNSQFRNYPSFDFNGRVSSDLSLRHAWIQGQAPMLRSADAITAIGTGNGVTIPTNGEIDILGRAGIVTQTLPPNIVEVANNRSYTPYIVGIDGPSLTSDDPAEFSSVQAAIDAAVSAGATITNKQFVRLKPGQYTENITLPPSIVLQGSGNACTALTGTITVQLNNATQTLIQDLTMIGAPALTTSDPGGVLVLFGCQVIQQDPNTEAVLMSCPLGAFSQFVVIAGALLGPIFVPAFPVAPTVRLTGAGSIVYQSQLSGSIFCYIRHETTSAGINSRFRMFNANGTDLRVEIVDPLCITTLLSCEIDNSNFDTLFPAFTWTGTTLQQQISACYFKNARFLMDGNTTDAIFRANVFQTDAVTVNPIFQLANTGNVWLAENTIIKNGASNWIDGVGNYNFPSFAGNDLRTNNVTSGGGLGTTTLVPVATL